MQPNHAMKVIFGLALPAAGWAQVCSNPRNTGQCGALMAGFSQTPAFNIPIYRSADCFNFCDGAFRNVENDFDRAPCDNPITGCFCRNPVVGCTRADIPGYVVTPPPPVGGTWSVASAPAGGSSGIEPLAGSQLAGGQLVGSAPSSCVAPRNTEQCPALMTSFSMNQVFNTIPQATDCFNFCGGIFQNTDTFYFGPAGCVAGCRRADIIGYTDTQLPPPGVANGVSLTSPISEETGGTFIAPPGTSVNGNSRWTGFNVWYPSGMQAGQLVPPAPWTSSAATTATSMTVPGVERGQGISPSAWTITTPPNTASGQVIQPLTSTTTTPPVIRWGSPTGSATPRLRSSRAKMSYEALPTQETSSAMAMMSPLWSLATVAFVAQALLCS